MRTIDSKRRPRRAKPQRMRHRTEEYVTTSGGTSGSPKANERYGKLRIALLTVAAALVASATFLPLWGMTLVSVQYPEGLRMVVYATEIRGDITELNLLNHYIGMQQISSDFFPELKMIPILFALIALGCLGAAVVRRTWAPLVPLVMMVATAAYGFWSMQRRLHQFGHDLDPSAAIDIEPFSPPMVGENVIAQFGSYSYFSSGTFLPMLAGGLVVLALWLDLRVRRSAEPYHG